MKMPIEKLYELIESLPEDKFIEIVEHDGQDEFLVQYGWTRDELIEEIRPILERAKS